MHGYEKYLEGCDCKICRSAFQFRIQARKSFEYYRPAERIVSTVSAERKRQSRKYKPARDAEYQREYRHKNKEILLEKRRAKKLRLA
jgi:hypothetical protein